jgi:lipopolysaccharide biosynthesis protein
MENQEANHKKVCVILHLYYVDLWGYFLPYLKRIDADIDLYVTITDGHSGSFTDIHDAIMSEFPQAYIYSLPNRGMDVAPFLYVMNEILQNERSYNVIIKLHSKKSLAHSYELGERWRNQLTDALLGSLPKLQNNYISCINTNSKMVGSAIWTLNQNVIGYEQQYFSQPITFTDYEFVGGTMFMVDFFNLMDWFVSEKIYERFYDKFEEGYIGDGSIAHHLERVFGCLIKLKGYNILKA